MATAISEKTYYIAPSKEASIGATAPKGARLKKYSRDEFIKRMRHSVAQAERGELISARVVREEMSRKALCGRIKCYGE